IENGLCEKSIFLSSSLYSYIGKSTIQASSNRSLSIRFSSSPSLVRAKPANFQNFAGSPATKNAASPSFNPSAARIADVRSGPMLLASGPAPSPPSRHKMYPRPGGPPPGAQDFIRSQSAREPPPALGIAQT